MKALVFEERLKAVVKEVEIPDPGPDWALVRVEVCGICGGDLHFLNGTHPFTHYPQINGHELVGVIERLPEGETGFAVGCRVVTEIIIPCGNCYPCRRGKPNCCTRLEVLGIHVPGGFGQYVAVPVKNLHKLPEGLTPDEAVLVEPYSIAHHVVGRSELRPDDTALVLGAGTIGLTILDVLKARGIRTIIADLSPYRLEKARCLGADFVVDSAKEDLEKAVMALTDGEGAGAVFEATGVVAVMEQTAGLVAAGGVIVIAGLTTQDVSFPGGALTRKEMTIKGSRNAAGDFEPVLAMLAGGRLHPQELLTKKIPIDDAPEAILSLLRDSSADIKAAVYF